MLDPNIWARRTVERCKRKERRRTGRAVKTATFMAENTSASLPAHMHPLHDMLALYRLLDEEDVTFNPTGNRPTR
ncbi:MAG: transposase DNA-binding-containing protein [Ktedonobacteraceae bacterium]